MCRSTRSPPISPESGRSCRPLPRVPNSRRLPRGKWVLVASQIAMAAAAEEVKIRVSEAGRDVSALLLRPPDARWLVVLAHGAGAGMRHAFMESVARELAAAGVATFRYQFPYREQGRGRPDPPGVLTATVRAALAAAADTAPDLPL